MFFCPHLAPQHGEFFPDAQVLSFLHSFPVTTSPPLNHNTYKFMPGRLPKQRADLATCTSIIIFTGTEYHSLV